MPSGPEAGLKFREWIRPERRLVIGGKLLEELEKTKARELISQFIKAGLVKQLNKEQIESKTKSIQNKGLCISDDPHVIALAQISGARLLYSNDKNLHQDFKNLLNKPRGKIYSTLKSKDFTATHKNILKNSHLCPPD